MGKYKWEVCDKEQKQWEQILKVFDEALDELATTTEETKNGNGQSRR